MQSTEGTFAARSRTDRVLTFWGDLLLTIPVLVVLIAATTPSPAR